MNFIKSDEFPSLLPVFPDRSHGSPHLLLDLCIFRERNFYSGIRHEQFSVLVFLSLVDIFLDSLSKLSGESYKNICSG